MMKKFFLSVAMMILLAALSFTNVSAAGITDNSAITGTADTPRMNQRVNQRADTNKFPQEVLRLVNHERAKVGAAPLKFAQDLTASAFVRATELPTKFSHTRPNGSKCFTAMPQRGHVLGENLAGGQTSPKQVVQAWMDSETHRANMLSKNFTEIGIVYYYQPNSKYKHYWVQHFRG